VSSDIYDENQKKYDYARLILRINTMSLDWFRFSHEVIALRPVYLYYAVKISCSR
jgi:hypothetical protein